MTRRNRGGRLCFYVQIARATWASAIRVWRSQNDGNNTGHGDLQGREG